MSPEVKMVRQCPTCGAQLPPDAPGGDCPRCLLALGLRALFPSSLDDAPVPTPSPGGEPLPHLDRYRILEKLGEGGCGIVYRAEQFEPVRREVAVKVIKLGMDTRNVVARFEAERQALALMDHPGIARVFDAGATREGRPFFAMELIRGAPITEHCQRHNLSLALRLELFADVCQAVQHAHQKGVIHRDLKPSNILVLTEAGHPQPKIIDFGVARATARQRLTDQTVYTAFDQFVGTPAYMSPEQAGLTGEDIDTRSDIYSLGVLLYELLTGRPPFDPGRLRHAALDEICRIIREEDPPRPSRVNSDAKAAIQNPKSDGAGTGAKHPLTHTAASELRGDLDWIVMKALEKDRARRYETANGLAADIRRFLANEPVGARPPSAAYRTRKFFQRHRLIVSLTAVALTAVLAGLVVSIWMYVQERASRQRAVAAERQQASLREEAEANAYAADLNLAARMVMAHGSQGGLADLLLSWRDRQPDRRGWEWYHLEAAGQPRSLSFTDGTNEFSSVAWSPAGQELAAVDRAGTGFIWNLAGERPRARLTGHTGEVRTVVWSPDGTRLATGSKDHSIRIWNAVTGTELLALTGQGGPVNCLAWRPDGRQLASGDGAATINLWNPVSGTRELQVRTGGGVLAVKWHPDGTQFAAVGWDNVLRVWDAVTGRELRAWIYESENSFLQTLDWSPDGRYLMAGATDFRLRFWDVASGELRQNLMAHGGAIVAAGWSPDGRHVASTGRNDGFIKVWGFPGLKLEQHLRAHLLGCRSLAWHPASNWIASASPDGTVKVWDLEHHSPALRTLVHEESIMSASWHPDGRQLATASKDAAIRVWTPGENRHVQILGKHDQWAWKVAWNPAGTRLASAGGEGRVKLWDAATGAEIWSANIFTNAARALAWSPDGQQLAVTGGEPCVAILDLNGREVRRFALPGPLVLAVAWSPDGRCLATEAADFGIQILEATTGTRMLTLRGHGAKLRSLAWSPDSLRLASSADDGVAKIWEARTGRVQFTLSGHSGAVYAVAWHPDGDRLATGSWDRTLKLWSPATGRLLCSFEELPSEITTLAWSSDGHALAAGNLAGQVIIRTAPAPTKP